MKEKQAEDWKKSKPQRIFMKSVKDTIDYFLMAELKKQSIEIKGINCVTDYRLTFGKNGKLKKVSVSDYDNYKSKNSHGLSAYIQNKRDILKCKSTIRRIFKELDLSILNLKSEVNRTLIPDHKHEFKLRDDTIY